MLSRRTITKRAVDALTCPPDKDRAFLWDAGLTGFGVAAMPSGAKVYVCQFRQHGRSRRITLGKHGRLTPDEARSMAKKLLGAVEDGADPIAERQANREIETFSEVAGRVGKDRNEPADQPKGLLQAQTKPKRPNGFLQAHIKTKRKAGTEAYYELLLRVHIYPAFGSKRVTSITKTDVSRLHTSMAKSPVAANRCLALISTVWNWGVIQGRIPASLPNPAAGIEDYPEQPHQRYLRPDEIKQLARALSAAETTGLPWDPVDEGALNAKHHRKKENRFTTPDPFAVAAIRLLMLTGARLREILNAKWSLLDIERGILFLEDSKSGPKPIYLSAAAINVLGAIPRLANNPHIIPGHKSGKPRADLKRPWSAIVRAAGLVEKNEMKGKDGKISVELRPTVRLHDLRHTLASIGAGLSLGLPIVGKLLGHANASTTQRYAHLDSAPMNRAINLIGNEIVAAMDDA